MSVPNETQNQEPLEPGEEGRQAICSAGLTSTTDPGNTYTTTTTTTTTRQITNQTKTTTIPRATTTTSGEEGSQTIWSLGLTSTTDPDKIYTTNHNNKKAKQRMTHQLPTRNLQHPLQQHKLKQDKKQQPIENHKIQTQNVIQLPRKQQQQKEQQQIQQNHQQQHQQQNYKPGKEGTQVIWSAGLTSTTDPGYTYITYHYNNKTKLRKAHQLPTRKQQRSLQQHKPKQYKQQQLTRCQKNRKQKACQQLTRKTTTI